MGCPKLSSFVLLLGLAGALLPPAATHAQPTSTGSGQAYPARPVRVVVGFTAGGATDLSAWFIAQKLSETIGVLTDEAQFMFSSPAAVMAQIRDGKMRALGVSGTTRSAVLPGVPTIRASSRPGAAWKSSPCSSLPK